jgi:hypothetical protein
MDLRDGPEGSKGWVRLSVDIATPRGFQSSERASEQQSTDFPVSLRIYPFKLPTSRALADSIRPSLPTKDMDIEPHAGGRIGVFRSTYQSYSLGILASIFDTIIFA